MSNPQQQPGPDYSSDAIQCTINNLTTGPIQYNSSSTTGGHLSISNYTVDSGSSQQVFSAQGPSGWPSGCGGQVTFNMPNGEDQLVVVYNCSVTGQSSQIYTELQNQNGKAAGSDSYFVVVTGGSADGTSLQPTVTVYDAGATASPTTGYVNSISSVQITVDNQLTSWVNLNSFPNPTWDIMPIITNATSSIAPGSSAIVLTSAEAYKFTLIYNITEDALLTIQQNESDAPTAGFNTSCTYTVSVTGGQSSNGYAYTVTISPLSDILKELEKK